MTKEQSQVKEFHNKMGNLVPTSPSLREPIMAKLRMSLIAEEAKETIQGIANSNLEEIADGLADLIYVCLGTAVEYGLNMDLIFQEVHRSNMSKFIDGYRREDGKWIKGPSWSPPNLEPFFK